MKLLLPLFICLSCFGCRDAVRYANYRISKAYFSTPCKQQLDSLHNLTMHHQSGSFTFPEAFTSKRSSYCDDHRMVMIYSGDNEAALTAVSQMLASFDHRVVAMSVHTSDASLSSTDLDLAAVDGITIFTETWFDAKTEHVFTRMGDAFELVEQRKLNSLGIPIRTILDADNRCGLSECGTEGRRTWFIHESVR